MGLIDNIREGVRNFLGIEDLEDKPRIDTITRNRDYRGGKQKKMLKVKGFDDNVVINVTGLVVDRWVSLLFGHGIEFDLPGDDPESNEQLYIDGIWKLNHKNILLHKIAVNGSEAGTAYLKIIPNGLGDKRHRMIALDPLFVKIETAPDDYETVKRYVVSYGDADDKRRVTEISEFDGTKWTVTKIVKEGARESKEDMKWAYPFAPIVHCQNLPAVDSCYGIPDIDDNTRGMQDSINFIASNINKIIRLHGHPQLWGNGLSAMKQVDVGVDKIIDIPAPGILGQIEMQSDLSSAQNFLNFFIKQLYATTRTIDLDSLADKLGALTNFGLHVLFQDTLTKLETKRHLYGEMLNEVNRRLLVINGMAEDAGEIHWNDVVPESDVEEVTALEADLRMGLVSKETAAMRRGYDYAQEQEKIAADKTSEGNIGDALLRAFNRNQL